MINVFVIKKWAGLITGTMFAVICYSVGLFFYGLLWGVGLLLIGLLLGLLITNLFLRNPFTGMLEGRGILALNIDSTGIIRPFLFGVQSPYVISKYNGKEINDVFDREAIYQLAPPQKVSKNVIIDKNKIQIILSEEEYNKAKFAMYHYPVIIWNDQIKSILTKDFLSNEEKIAFAEHTVLYLNRKMEELTSAVRDFGRHVVELTKPVTNILKSKWTWIIIGIAVLIMVLLFGPAVLQQFSDNIQNTPIGSAFGAAKQSTSAIVPK